MSYLNKLRKDAGLIKNVLTSNATPYPAQKAFDNILKQDPRTQSMFINVFLQTRILMKLGEVGFQKNIGRLHAHLKTLNVDGDIWEEEDRKSLTRLQLCAKVTNLVNEVKGSKAPLEFTVLGKNLALLPKEAFGAFNILADSPDYISILAKVMDESYEEAQYIKRIESNPFNVLAALPQAKRLETESPKRTTSQKKPSPHKPI